jgi:hypothetical protein
MGFDRYNTVKGEYKMKHMVSLILTCKSGCETPCCGKRVNKNKIVSTITEVNCTDCLEAFFKDYPAARGK